MKKEMTSQDVVDLYKALEPIGIKIWIDGGWAVDALVGTQTRAHEDLDIAVEKTQCAKLVEYLESEGYTRQEISEDKRWDATLLDKEGHQIEIHSFDLDENKKIIEKDEWGEYRRDSLTGLGLINGYHVRCVSVAYLLSTHDPKRRTLKESDHKDLAVLRKKFNIDSI